MAQMDSEFDTYEVYSMAPDYADQENGFSSGPYQRVKDNYNSCVTKRSA